MRNAIIGYRSLPLGDLVGVRVQLDLQALGVSQAVTCELRTPDAKTLSLPVNEGAVVVPTLDLWGLLVFED